MQAMVDWNNTYYAAPTGAFVCPEFVRSRVLGRDFFDRFQSP